MDEKQEFEMGLPNGVGEQMLAHTIEKFDVKLEHTEFGPKLIGTYEELEKADDPALQRYAWRLPRRADRREAGGRRVAALGLCQQGSA